MVTAKFVFKLLVEKLGWKLDENWGESPASLTISEMSEQVKGVRDRFWEIGNCPSIIDDVACILSKRRFLLRLTVRETGGKLLQFGGNYFTGGIDGSST